MPITPRTAALCAPLALSLTLALAGCGTDPVQAPAAREAAPASAGPALAIDVPILGKVSGDQLTGDDYGVKLMDVAGLAGTGLGQAFASAGVDLDADHHSVVLLALGEQPSSGFAADITALQRKGGTLYVQGTASAPAQDAAVTAFVTHPFAAVAIERVPVGTVVRSDIK